MNPDEYVGRLKAQIDEWNADMARCEQQMRGASEGARQEYERRLEQYRVKLQKK